MEISLKQRALSSAEANANALREDFQKLIEGQQEMYDNIDNLKYSIYDQIDSTLKTVKDLKRHYEAEQAAKKVNKSAAMNIARGRINAPSTAPSTLPEIAANTRTPVRNFSVFNKNDLMAAREKHLAKVGDTRKKGGGSDSSDDSDTPSKNRKSPSGRVFS